MDSEGQSDPSENRGKKTQQDAASSCTERRILLSKAFYTFFYVAVGSLFPYLPVYFKQLHLSPHQTGVLIGVRPLIQFLMTPIWGACADRLCKSKVLLLMSVLGWLVSNFSLSLVPDTSRSKFCGSAHTEALGDGVALRQTLVESNTSKRNTPLQLMSVFRAENTSHPNSALSPLYTYLSLESLTKACDKKENVSKHWSYKGRGKHWNDWPLLDTYQDLTQEEEGRGDGAVHDGAYLPCDSAVFIFLLVVTVVGTMISAPTQMLADTATLQSLNGECHLYGRVRLWGSLGWGVGGFSVGTAVSLNYRTDSCGEVFIDYQPCFYVYAAAIALAFLCATQFEFNYSFANLPTEKPGLAEGLKLFRRPQFCFVMFLAFYCGSATGFIETFLFWYLHELGGGQLLFSTINGLNCLAEVAVFFLTDRLLSTVGHIKVMYLALVCYSVRFFYFYVVVKPWFVLPAELLQGVTTAAFWAACVSYVGLHPGAAHTLQGILNGFYMGLGFATGGFAGGGLVHYVGMPNAFLLYAVSSLLLLVLFMLVNAREYKSE